MRFLLSEFKKAKYRKLWFLIIGVIGFQFLWNSLTLIRESKENLETGYHYMLYDIPLMNALIMSLVLAVLSSRIWDIEVKGNTFKILCTLQSRKSIYNSKTIYGIIFITVFCTLQIISIIALGTLFHFGDTIPANHLAFLFITTFMVSMVIFFIQQIFSFLCNNQFAPLCIGLIGSFTGLFTAFLPRTVQKFIIWSYYSLLQTAGMSWNDKTKSMNFYYMTFNLKLLLFTTCLACLMYLIGKVLFIRKEV